MNIEPMSYETIVDEISPLSKNSADHDVEFARRILAARDAQYAAMAGQEPVAWPAELSSTSRTQPVRFSVIHRDDGEPVIDDDDFKFDALIKVHGDFDEGEKEKYVAEVCRRLNGPAPTNPAAQERVPDGVWEALQRMIEDGFNKGQGSRDDARTVSRWRARFVPAREAAQERAEPVAPAVDGALMTQLEWFALAAHWYINASDRELSERGESREDALKQVHLLSAHIEASGFNFSATPPAPAQPSPMARKELTILHNGDGEPIGLTGRSELMDWLYSLPHGVTVRLEAFDAAQPSTEPSKPEQAEAPSDDARKMLRFLASKLRISTDADHGWWPGTVAAHAWADQCEKIATLPPAIAAGEREDQIQKIMKLATNYGNALACSAEDTKPLKAALESALRAALATKPQAAPSDTEALQRDLIAETERAMRQRDEFLKTGVSTASHGGSHDTCFPAILRQHGIIATKPQAEQDGGV